MATAEQIEEPLDLPSESFRVTTYLSFGVFMLGMNCMLFIVLQQYPFFYETRVGLDIGLIAVAGIIYTIWDMFNDPLVGHFSDKNYGFTQRIGKRFPWITGGIIPLVVALVLFFSPPDIDSAGQIVVFIWFVVFLSVYDGLTSAILVNYNALIPVKFKSKETRRNIGSFIHLFMMLGPFVGLIFVSIIITSDASSFQTLSIVLAGFVLLSYLFSIPGLREDQSLKETYLNEEITEKSFREEFGGNISQAFREKEFVILVIVTVGITITTALIAISTPYYVQYVYGITDPNLLGQFIAQVSLPFVLTTIVGIPIYFWIIAKIGHVKAFKYSLLLAVIPLLIIFSSFYFGGRESLSIVMLGAGLWSVFGGILQISRIPLQGDFFDASAIKYQRRQEGMYLGLWNFFSRVVTVVMLGILAIVHTLTSFDSQIQDQPTSALWGIMSHFGLIPAIFLFIAALIFWKYWDIDEEKRTEIKEELEKLGL